MGGYRHCMSRAHPGPALLAGQAAPGGAALVLRHHRAHPARQKLGLYKHHHKHVTSVEQAEYLVDGKQRHCRDCEIMVSKRGMAKNQAAELNLESAVSSTCNDMISDILSLHVEDQNAHCMNKRRILPKEGRYSAEKSHS